MDLFPQPKPTEAALAEQYLAVARDLRRRTQLRLGPLGLNPHSSRALRVIGRDGPLRPSAVAEQLGIAPRSATDSIAALAAAGLIERRRDPADGRAQLLAVTAAGDAVLTEVSAIRKEVARTVFGRLSRAERDEFALLLAKLSQRDLP